MKAQEGTYDSVELAQIVHPVWGEKWVFILGAKAIGKGRKRRPWWKFLLLDLFPYMKSIF